MLYFLFIGLLYIGKVSAQCSSYSTETACENNGCDWNDDSESVCGTPDQGLTVCCFDSPTADPTTAAPTTPEPTTGEPTPSPTCPSAGTCENIETEECCRLLDCDWEDDSESVCGTPDQGNAVCCTTPTPEPTTPSPTERPTTPEPTTPSPTEYDCPDTFTSCISIRSSECCLDYQDRCDWLPTDKEICGTVDASAGECCVRVTDSPTTPEPTTPAPTTPEPTTPEPTTTTTTTTTTTAEPTRKETTTTTTTAEPTRKVTTTTTTTTTTAEPTRKVTTTTTTTAEPTKKETTAEPTKKVTTPWPTKKETTAEPTKKEEETSTTASWGKVPTKRPTLPSAMKWEMIHPAYKGNDGELLWQIYYGDFSDDDRFDSFRKAEKWDAAEIRPIFTAESKFAKYSKQQTIVSDSHATNSQSYGKWLIGISAALIILFAIWYKYKDAGNKHEYVPLLQEEKVQYGQ